MKPLSYLSLGWGIQSTTLAAMMAFDEIPRADYIIHADTTHEKEATYEYAERMTPWFGEHGIDIVTVRGKWLDVAISQWGDGTSVMIPAFTLDKVDGSKRQVRRQCTSYWKINPIRQFITSELKRLGRPKSRDGLQLRHRPGRGHYREDGIQPGATS